MKASLFLRTTKLHGRLAIVFLFFCWHNTYAQSLEGYVYDQQGEPVPFVNIFVKALETGTNTDQKGHYFMLLEQGHYQVIFSAIGYETKTVDVIIGDGNVKKDIRLSISETQLEEIIVRSNQKDPAYEIIKFAIDHKKNHKRPVNSFKSDVYIRASELMEEVPGKKKKSIVDVDDAEPIDIFAAEEKKANAALANHHITEINMVFNYQAPNHFKEERNGYKSFGSKDGLFLPNLSDVKYSFYDNLVVMKGISDSPVISPLAKTAILSYKYKLINTTNENGVIVYKIKVTPRKSGNSTCEGFIYINDGTWSINRLSLKLNKSGLVFFDGFEVNQNYEAINDSTWLPTSHVFEYFTKSGRTKTFKGQTVIKFSNYQPNFEFPAKFFSNELAVTTKEAYERDTSYWSDKRTIPLSDEQMKAMAYRDSIAMARKSKKYLDSIQERYNKMTAIELLVEGVGFRNDEKKQHIYLSGALSFVNFEVIGGWRIGPYASYFRRFKNEKFIWMSGNLNFGLKNKDLLGNFRSMFRYDPFRLGDIYFSTGRAFHSINSFDAYLNQLKISNYILHRYISIGHRIEILNGLYFETELNFRDRESVNDLEYTSILNEVIDETSPLAFQNYQALITNIGFSFTPAQKYMREPYRKVVLGSKYPTFSIHYKKGWDGPASSDIDFDYVDVEVKQDVILGVLGNSKYNFKVGRFLTRSDLREVDLKRFRQSDPYLYSDPLNSFQLLDTSLVARQTFIEGHIIHHFNGALINNIPLIKKLKLRTVAGAGFLWVQDTNYRYQEFFAGVERIFKLGKRRRLRLGVYGVAGDSNFGPAKPDFKISFDVIDTWKKNWSF